MHKSILEAIGKTPLVMLSRISSQLKLNVYAKMEASNPGGSIKDRAAVHIIEGAIKDGSLHQGSTVVESSSGNMGIGLAQVCNYHRIPFICVVDNKITKMNLSILQAYGVKVDMVRAPDPETGEYLTARLNRVRELLASNEHAFWPNQYLNKRNSESHYLGTFKEIFEDLGGDVDYVLCATSTCGTIDGCVRYIREHNLKTKVIAVDALGSLIFSDRKAKRLIPGFGASTKPDLCPYDYINEYIHVTDSDCIRGCRWLLESESILAGGSSGGVVSALRELRKRIPEHSRCVMIFPDRGERYMDTIYSEAWVQLNIGSLIDEVINVRLVKKCMDVSTKFRMDRKLLPSFRDGKNRPSRR